MKKVLLIFVLALGGCNYERLKMGPQNPLSGGPVDPERVPSTFAEIQSGILLSSSCFRCHGPEGTSGIEIHQYEHVMQYVDPGNPDGSDFYDFLKTGYMPRGPQKITGTLLEGVRQWILNGALEK